MAAKVKEGLEKLTGLYLCFYYKCIAHVSPVDDKKDVNGKTNGAEPVEDDAEDSDDEDKEEPTEAVGTGDGGIVFPGYIEVSTILTSIQPPKRRRKIKRRRRRREVPKFSLLHHEFSCRISTQVVSTRKVRLKNTRMITHTVQQMRRSDTSIV